MTEHEDTVNDPDLSQLTSEEQADFPVNPEGIDEMVDAEKTNADPDTPKTANEVEAVEANEKDAD